MTTETLYNASKLFAAVLAIGSAVIATASNLPDLGLSRQTVAVLTLVQTGITTALLFLPAVQHPAGTVRGAGVDDH
jgi:hypothetical protein